MSASESTKRLETTLTQDIGAFARHWLRDRRVLIALAVAIVAAGAALNWGWLVAVGVAPLLLSLAPCAIMCALGVCMMGRGVRRHARKERRTGLRASSTRTIFKRSACNRRPSLFRRCAPLRRPRTSRRGGPNPNARPACDERHRTGLGRGAGPTRTDQPRRMTMRKRTLMTTAGAAALALAVATGVQAQQAAPDAKPDQQMSGQGSGGMGQGMPMMGMMQQMNEMIANCNRMMQTTMDRKGDQPKEQDGDKPAPQSRG